MPANEPRGGRAHMKRPGFFYGWVVVAVAFTCLAVAYAIWHSFAIFYVAILDEFGWSRASTALAFSIFTVVYGLGSPLSGTAVDRYGPRVVIPIGAVVLALGLFASSRISEIWHLYVFYGVFTAVGVNLVGTIVNFTVLANWFSRRRGTAIGIASAGIGAGMLVFVPAAQYIIQEAGWRSAYIALGLLVLAIIPVVTILFHRHRPEDMGLPPDGVPKALRNTAAAPPPLIRVVNKAWASTEWTVGSALRTRTFWFLFFGLMFGTWCHQSVMVHHVAYLRDRGFDPMIGATVVGLVGIFGSVGKVIWGWTSDRIGRETAYALGMGCVAGGVVVLALVVDGSQLPLMYFYTCLFGIGYGVYAPLTSSTSADLFQGRRFGSIYGVLYIGSGTGSAIGPWVSGQIFDTTGSYTLAWGVAVGAAFLSIAGLWLAGPRLVRLVPGVAARRAVSGAERVTRPG